MQSISLMILKGRYQAVNLLLKDADGTIYGGLVGEICWNWLEVQYLFVDDNYRKMGYGMKLMSDAEQIAKEKKCEFIKVDYAKLSSIRFLQETGI